LNDDAKSVKIEGIIQNKNRLKTILLQE